MGIIKKYINKIASEVFDDKYESIYHCNHEWELIFNIKDNEMIYEKMIPINYIKVYRCQKCGKEKRYETRISK